MRTFNNGLGGPVKRKTAEELRERASLCFDEAREMKLEGKTLLKRADDIDKKYGVGKTADEMAEIKQGTLNEQSGVGGLQEIVKS